MKMKSVPYFLIIFLTTFLLINCAPHCDDEDYTRDQKAIVYHKDSLHVIID
jgi:hypothetical protein